MFNNLIFSKRILKEFLIIEVTLLLFTSKIQAWSNLEGGDHGGDDWIISSNINLSGVHINIGRFIIDTGIEVKIEPQVGGNYGFLEVRTDTIAI